MHRSGCLARMYILCFVILSVVGLVNFYRMMTDKPKPDPVRDRAIAQQLLVNGKKIKGPHGYEHPATGYQENGFQVGYGDIPSKAPENRMSGSRAGYYLYIPKSVSRRGDTPAPLLVFLPGQNVRADHALPGILKNMAEEEGFVILALTFYYTGMTPVEDSYLYPRKWSGFAMMEVIQEVKKKNNLSFTGIYLYGFSAGAQFALRFALYRPELCVACAAHACGGSIIPRSHSDVRFFVTVGARDEPHRIEIHDEFIKAAKDLNLDVQSKIYPQLSHNPRSDQLRDVQAFLQDSFIPNRTEEKRMAIRMERTERLKKRREETETLIETYNKRQQEEINNLPSPDGEGPMVLHLKNGRKIQADKVRTKGDSYLVEMYNGTKTHIHKKWVRELTTDEKRPSEQINSLPTPDGEGPMVLHLKNGRKIQANKVWTKEETYLVEMKNGRKIHIVKTMVWEVTR